MATHLLDLLRPLLCWRARKTKKIVQLPDEILLRILCFLDGAGCNKDLANVALAHRRLYAVAQEVLFKNAVVPMSGLPRYIELLLEKPQWAATITRLRLVQRSSITSLLDASMVPPLSLQVRNACRELLSRLGYPSEEGAGLSDLQSYQDHVTVCFCLLFSRLPSLRELCFRTSSFTWPFIASLLSIRVNGPEIGNALDEQVVTDIVTKLRNRLEVLHIHEASPVYISPEHLIVVRNFRSLKSLLVPSRCLTTRIPTPWISGWAAMAQLQQGTPITLLPRGLEQLRMYVNPCTFSLDWFTLLYDSRNHFSNLKTVEVYFECQYATFVTRANLALSTTNFAGVLWDFEHCSNISLKTFFLPNDRYTRVGDPSYFMRRNLLLDLRTGR